MPAADIWFLISSVIAVIACVPLITHNYASSGNCYIGGFENDSLHTMVIVKTAFWDAPAIVILIIISIAMVVMVVKLAHTARLRAGNQITKALRQLLPLVAFPILSTVCIIVYST